MIFHDSNKSLFEQLSSLHKAAELAIKESESYNAEIPIPALKELRDAYHHFDNALQLDIATDQEKELYRAISHCKRAYFDSKECTFQYLLENTESIKEKLDRYVFILGQYIPEYPTHKKNIKAALSFYHEIKDLKVEARETRYSECDKHIANLKAFIQAYSDLEDDILADIYNRKRTVRIGAIIGILGILCSIIAFF